MNNPHNLTIQPGPHFGGQLPPLEWRNGFPYIAPQASEGYSLCPDGAPDRFCILTKPANGLVATCLIMAGGKTCDTTTGLANHADTAGSTHVAAEAMPPLVSAALQLIGGSVGLAILVVGVAAKGGYEYVLRPLTRAAWAYLTRPPKRELPKLRDVRMPESRGVGYQQSNNVFNGGTHYHVHNY